MKPTLGNVGNLQPPDLFTANSYVGPMARDIADTALLYEVIRGGDKRDPFGQAPTPTGRPTIPSLHGVKVAWLPTAGNRIDPQVEQLTTAAVQAMADAGAEVEQIELDFVALEKHFLVLLESTLAARLGPQLADIEARLDPSLVATIRKGLQHSAVDLHHAGFARGADTDILWIDAEEVNGGNVAAKLMGAQGLIVPGGFGGRGIEGKIAACRYARESGLPFLGICLGMQVAVIEFSRNICGLKEANSTEFADTPYPVIDLMPDQIGVDSKGGTMRLGSYPCRALGGSLLETLYGTADIHERHRHRYELNNDYRDTLSAHGLVLSGTSPDGRLVEAVELPSAVHPFYIGVQYHPVFKSRPNRAHPLFVGLVEAALAAQAANAE